MQKHFHLIALAILAITCGAFLYSVNTAKNTEGILGTSLTALQSSNTGSVSMAVINANFSKLNGTKLQNSDFTGSTGITYTATGTIGFDCSEVEGTGINCTGEAVTLDATGDWTGTLDGTEGANFVTHGELYASTSLPNLTIVESQISDLGTYLTSESDPIWLASSSSYYTSDQVDALSLSINQLGQVGDVSTTSLANGNTLTYRNGWKSTSTLSIANRTGGGYGVGIGTTTVGLNTLRVIGDIEATDDILVRDSMYFYDGYSTVHNNNYFGISGDAFAFGSDNANIEFLTNDGDITFEAWNGGSNGNIFLLSDGNVGIGTTTTSFKLDVDGSIRAIDDVNIGGSINYQGWTLSTSTVVCMAPEKCEFQCDGTADDVQIQAAISRGGKIEVKEGNYDMSAALNIGVPFWLNGAGVGKTNFVTNASFSGFAVFYDFDAVVQDSKITNITFDGNQVDNIGAIEIAALNNFELSDNEFKKATSSTLRWNVILGTIDNGEYASTSSHFVNVLNNYFHDMNVGTNEVLLMVNTSNSHVDGNSFADTRSTAYAFNYFGNCNNNTANDNVFNNTDGGAIFLLDCTNTIADGNVITASSTGQRGIDIANGRNIVVSNNSIKLYNDSGSAGSGITQWDFTAFDDHPVVNTRSSGIAITGNTIDTPYYGISLSTHGTYLNTISNFNVSNNTIVAPIGRGIYVGRWTDSSMNIDAGLIAGNAIYGGSYFDTAAITVEGYSSDPGLIDDITIINNLITPSSNANRAGGVQASAATNMNVYGNSMDGTSAGGYAGHDLRITAGATFDNLSVITNGKFGFGTSTPLQTLTVQGSAGEDIFCIAKANGECVFKINEDGTCSGTACGSGTSASSTATTVCMSPDVCDYVCDGTDDSIQIQAALDASPANGGDVYLKQGLYDIDATVIIPKQTTLRGAGKGTKLKAKASLNDEILSTTNDLVVIKDMWIDGNSFAQASGKCINIYGSWSSKIQNVYLEYCKDQGIYVDGASNDKTSELLIENTDIMRTQGESIESTDNTQDLKLVDNYAEIASSTCYVIKGYGHEADNIHAYDCNGNGLYHTGGRMIILGGDFENNGDWGMNIDSSAGSSIIGTKIFNNDQNAGGAGGLVLTGTTASTSVVGCQIYSDAGQQNYGIKVDTNSKGNSIFGNQIYGNADGTINFVNTNSTAYYTSNNKNIFKGDVQISGLATGGTKCMRIGGSGDLVAGGEDCLTSNGNIAWTGSHDFGGATLELPNGASGFTNTTGQAFVDTTGSGQLRFNYGTGTSTLTELKSIARWEVSSSTITSYYYGSLTASTTGRYPASGENMTATLIKCYTTNATSSIKVLGEYLKCGSNSKTSDTAIATPSVLTTTMPTYQILNNNSGTPNWTMIEIYGKPTPN